MSDDCSKNALFDKSPEQWTYDELKAGFFALLSTHNEATKAPAESDKLIETQRAFIGELLSNIENLNHLVILKTSAQAQPQTPNAAKRKQGRPLIKEMFKDLFKVHGIREGKVDSPECGWHCCHSPLF